MIPDTFTRGPASLPRFPTITAAFNHNATFYPEDVAAIDISQTPPAQITYGHLHTRAISLSRKLRSAGVQPGDRVPLVVKRSIDMLVGIYAILYAGAQYIPLDGGVAPDSTVRLVVAQSSSRILLCMKSTRRKLATFETSHEVVAIDELETTVPEYDAEITSDDFSTASSGCYVIYTSGTTPCSAPHAFTH